MSSINANTANVYSEEEFISEYSKKECFNHKENPSTVIFHHIQNLLEESKNQETIPLNKLNDFQKELVYRYVIYNEEVFNCLSIINIISDANRQIKADLPLFDSINWKNIVISCKNYLNFSNGLKITSDNIKHNYNKDFSRAESIKFLMKKGCDIEIHNSDIIIFGLEELYDELDKKIKKIGGINLIFLIFELLEYNNKFHRFIFRRTLNMTEITDPFIPYGYILNLALKHPQYKNQTKHIKVINLLNEIVELATALTNGVFDVQYYNIFSHVFQSGKTLNEYLHNIVLHDTLFTIPQSNISYEINLCKILFDFHDDFFKDALEFSLNDLLLVMKHIQNLDKFNRGRPILFSLGKDIIIQNLTFDEIIKILDFFSHDKCNSDYLKPDDYSKIDFWKKPLIKLSHNYYFLPSLSWSSQNLYECIVSSLRMPYKNKFNKNLDEDLGKRLELFLQLTFKENNIKYYTGNFDEYGIKGECDFLIECNPAIIIIELKKKVLTTNSKSGKDYSIFIDLLNSLLKSQYQSSKVEFLLRKYGSITLKDDNKEKNIHFNNRRIVRISLTHLDYGMLQNNLVSTNFLKSLLNYSYGIENGDVKLNRKFEDFEENRKLWVDLFNALCELDNNLGRNLFFEYYFLDLNKFLTILNESEDNNSFFENLPKDNFFHISELDWYFVYDRLLSI